MKDPRTGAPIPSRHVTAPLPSLTESTEHSLENAVTDFCSALQSELNMPNNPEFLETPTRVAKLWRENLLAGYAEDPRSALKEKMPAVSDGLIMVRNIPFHTICPHHLTPCFGHVSIAYQPSAWIVGFGAIEKLIWICSRRATLQENLTAQLASTIMNELEAKGVVCFIQAHHLCMSLQERESQNTSVCTRVALGSLQERHELFASECQPFTPER